MSSSIQVAVGVLINAHKEVLIAKRPAHLHQGGLWEFPGGKVHADETVLDALKREFLEEVNLVVHSAKPLTAIHYDYPEKSVCLNVYESRDFEGVLEGREGQLVKWVSVRDLESYHFPEANQPLLDLLKPSLC